MPSNGPQANRKQKIQSEFAGFVPIPMPNLHFQSSNPQKPLWSNQRHFVALFSINDYNRVACAFAECVIMAYLGTTLQAISFPSTGLLRLLRSDFGDTFKGSDLDDIFPLPSFSKEGLNRVWSLAQGCKGINPERSEHKKWTETNQDVCGNCRLARPAPPGDSDWRGWKEDSRCWKCYIWRSRHQTERNGWLSLQDHQQWLEETGLEDTCQNPACGIARPVKYRMKQWTGFGPESRCYPCREHIKKHACESVTETMMVCGHLTSMLSGLLPETPIFAVNARQKGQKTPTIGLGRWMVPNAKTVGSIRRKSTKHGCLRYPRGCVLRLPGAST